MFANVVNQVGHPYPVVIIQRLFHFMVPPFSEFKSHIESFQSRFYLKTIYVVIGAMDEIVGVYQMHSYKKTFPVRTIFIEKPDIAKSTFSGARLFPRFCFRLGSVPSLRLMRWSKSLGGITKNKSFAESSLLNSSRSSLLRSSILDRPCTVKISAPKRTFK